VRAVGVQSSGRPGRSFRYEQAELKELNAHAAFLRDVPHHCLQEALVDLQTGFDRFFKGIAGYPRPRLKGQNDSFRFPDPKQFCISGHPMTRGSWFCTSPSSASRTATTGRCGFGCIVRSRARSSR